MKKEKIFQIVMIISYSIWCFMNIYIMWSALRLNSFNITSDTIVHRQNLYHFKSMIGFVGVVAYLFDNRKILSKSGTFIEKRSKMFGDIMILMAISLVAIIGTFFLTGSINGWMSFFELLYSIMYVTIILFIIWIWDERKRYLEKLW